MFSPNDNNENKSIEAVKEEIHGLLVALSTSSVTTVLRQSSVFLELLLEARVVVVLYEFAHDPVVGLLSLVTCRRVVQDQWELVSFEDRELIKSDLFGFALGETGKYTLTQTQTKDTTSANSL